MEVVGSVLWKHVPTVVVLYVSSLAVYRLFFHPLAKFPGPRIAAITRWYEGYHDVIRPGQYEFRIAEMHEKYGPIVRISPYELHVSDPAFFDVIFSRKGRWDKYDWTYNALGPQGATVFTVDHDDHRRRRAPLNPFFSKANVFRKREIIERNAQRLLSRVDHFAGHGDRVIDIGAGLSAFVRDVTDEFVCGTAGTNLDADDFNTKLSKLIAGSGVQWRVTKHVWWFGPLLHQLPMPVLKLLLGENLHIFREFLGNLQKIVHAIYASEPNPASPTIVHEILASDLPPADKVVSRVGPEIGTITAAGYETTATALRHIVYSTFSSPEVLRKVREEMDLAKSKFGVEGELGLAELQQLPYLTAVLKEGLRLSPGVATRMARRTDHDLTYGDWCIPAGTPVGMTTLGMHLDEQSYPHATEFIPERWIGDEDGKNPRVYAPFSRGTRNCLGMHLAWAELYSIVGGLVQRFDLTFEGVGPEDFRCVKDDFTIATASHHHLRATVRNYGGW